MTFTYTYQFFTPSGALAARIHRDVQDLVTPRPTVAVTGSWLTVKEQMPDRYARALAERGITAVTFDFSGSGPARARWPRPSCRRARSSRSPLSPRR